MTQFTPEPHMTPIAANFDIKQNNTKKGIKIAESDTSDLEDPASLIIDVTKNEKQNLNNEEITNIPITIKNENSYIIHTTHSRQNSQHSNNSVSIVIHPTPDQETEFNHNPYDNIDHNILNNNQKNTENEHENNGILSQHKKKVLIKINEEIYSSDDEQSHNYPN
eukprot:UN06815